MTVPAALVLAAAITGCGGAGDRPMTPEERAQAIRALQAQPLERDVRPDKCDEAPQSAQIYARQTHFSGSEAFDSWGCNGPRSSP